MNSRSGAPFMKLATFCTGNASSFVITSDFWLTTAMALALSLFRFVLEPSLRCRLHAGGGARDRLVAIDGDVPLVREDAALELARRLQRHRLGVAHLGLGELLRRVPLIDAHVTALG